MDSPCLFKTDRPMLQIIFMCICTHLAKSGLYKYYIIMDNAFIVDVPIKVDTVRSGIGMKQTEKQGYLDRQFQPCEPLSSKSMILLHMSR